MTITKHCIERFRERVTEAPVDFIYSFILEDLKNSILLYAIDGVEKRYINGLLYVVKENRVITLYLYRA
ncbi:hypothetical protein [Domibacillus enclensis]|uniref:Uncharacterized protein n=1 Tax=Domibacillus enclensis TaxID=1017273 RepID=A0A1N7C046_9BACI|nr:hypothetical protein [Domibacillus enclensis]OXS74182.1 hypothetical protein B1B05_17050 [Domibacillus enclensis]SIR56959.1 hypothetical protein SAMN05443094_1111 [Domibacillus enclensis]